MAEYLFIVMLAVVIPIGGLVTLFVVGALFDFLDHPSELQSRIEAFFRRPPAPPQKPGKDHYYRPYWEKGV